MSSQFMTITQIIKAARSRLEDPAWDYLAGGAGRETGLARNHDALQKITFRPRVLRDVSTIDPSRLVLGKHLRIPVFLSPIGSLGRFHAEGTRASARASAQFGTEFFYGLHAEVGMEEIVRESERPMVFQLYVRGGLDWAVKIVTRAKQLGFHAICVTVDSPVQGWRERDVISGFDRLDAYRRPNVVDVDIDPDINKLAALTWDDIRKLRDATDLKLILKGIQTGEDAATAVEVGADAVYISNHGGRQLEHARATIDILPEVVAAVGNRAEILIDSGFVSGGDIVKALALGANAVGIGKLHGFAIAADGENGIYRTLEILEAEIVTTLGLLGLTSTDGLNSSLLAGAPHAHSND